MQERLKALGNRTGMFMLTGDNGKPCCIACRKFLRENGRDQLGSISVYPDRKIMLCWWVCLDCAGAADLTDKAQVVTP